MMMSDGMMRMMVAVMVLVLVMVFDGSDGVGGDGGGDDTSLVRVSMGKVWKGVERNGGYTVCVAASVCC